LGSKVGWIGVEGFSAARHFPPSSWRLRANDARVLVLLSFARCCFWWHWLTPHHKHAQGQSKQTAL